jgi:hypothetical protein
MGAYTVSSSLVTYLLGSMQSVFREVKSSMYPIWAVTLYILIGCADSITAYSLGDNEQFYRAVVSVALVMYNIYIRATAYFSRVAVKLGLHPSRIPGCHS